MHLLVAQRLRKFPGTDNLREIEGVGSLSQCRRRVCDVAVRHVYIVAARSKAEVLCHREHRRRGKYEPSPSASNTAAGYGILETRDYLLTRPGKAKNLCAIMPWLATMTGLLP